MRILLTGHEGYIGRVMAPVLERAGHEVLGLDSYLYDGCDFAPGPAPGTVASLEKDVRDVVPADLEGVDAVVHLAALSNDPLGDLDSEMTRSINRRGSLRLAEAARRAGVRRFLLASSCSIYGDSGGIGWLDEEAEVAPLTPYAESKIDAEADLAELADDSFSPTYLRNATVYGVSPRLRTDVVVNNLVGSAHVTGRVLLRSDGASWRPHVHVRDVCQAFLAVLEAPREKVHDVAFNVGRSSENYRIREIAELVAEAMPGTRVEFADGATHDARSYRVDCSRLETTLEGYRPQWTVADGIAELREAYARFGLDRTDLEGRYVRVRHVRKLIEGGLVDAELRWRDGGNDVADPDPTRNESRREAVG